MAELCAPSSSRPPKRYSASLCSVMRWEWRGGGSRPVLEISVHVLLCARDQIGSDPWPGVAGAEQLATRQ